MNDIYERNIKFGKRLVKERKKAGLTQARLADKIEGDRKKARAEHYFKLGKREIVSRQH